MQPPPVYTQTDRDTEHLRLLAVFHFVAAGLALLGIVVLAIELVVFTMLPDILGVVARNTKGAPSPEELEQIGFAFDLGVWFIAAILAFVVAEFVLNLVAAFDLLKRRRRTLCLVVAALNCFSVPLGTGLGVFTFIVLSRDSVRDLYARP